MDQLKNLISLREASKISGYHADYISSLIRLRKIRGKRIGRNWFTTKQEIERYLTAKKFVSAERVVRSKARSSRLLIGMAAGSLIFGGLSLYSYFYDASAGKTAEIHTFVASPAARNELAAPTIFT